MRHKPLSHTHLLQSLDLSFLKGAIARTVQKLLFVYGCDLLSPKLTNLALICLDYDSKIQLNIGSSESDDIGECMRISSNTVILMKPSKANDVCEKQTGL